MALRGYIDGITPTGFIEGWAIDDRAPGRPLDIRIRAGDEWIASGLCHHFRHDLMAAQIGTGWCAFRLRTECPVETVKSATLYIVARDGSVVAKSQGTVSVPAPADELRTIEDVIGADPTIAGSIDQLRGCQPLFAQFIRSHGVEAFVRTAYLYALGRPVDDAGLRTYGGRLRRGSHEPIELLEILATSEEFVTRRCALVAPTQPSFPFLSA